MIGLLTMMLAIRSILTTPISIDSYTHMAIGQYILKNHAIPRHRDISFKQTDPSLEWLSHSWLSDTILYMAQLPKQLFGVILLVIPLLFLSVYLAGVLLQTVTTTSNRYIYLCIPIICSLSFWRYHPFLFIIPLQLLLMMLLGSWHRHPRSIIAIPPIFILWANMSGGTIVIPMLYLPAYVASELIIHRRAARLLFLIPVSFAATLVNPYGIRIWVYTLTTMAVVQQNKSFSSLIGAINTINQTYNKQQFSSAYLVLFAAYTILLIMALLSIAFNKPGSLRPAVRLLPALIFLPLAFFWVRFIPLAAFSTLPLFVWCIEDIIARISNRTRKKISYVILSVASIGIIALLIRLPMLASPKIPTDHVTRIRDFSLPANILTTYDLTGYIMYSLPEYKAMVDAQDDLLNDESLISFYQPVGNFSRSFTDISDKLSVQTALMSRDIGGLSSTLSQTGTWKLIYIDYTAALYVDQSSMDDAFFQTNALHTVRLETNLGFDPDNSASAAAELETFTRRYPENTLLLGQLATIYRIRKEFARADQTFLRVPKPAWSFSLYTEYGRLSAAQGKCILAEDNFLKALTYRNEKNYSRTVLDLAILYAGCFKDTKRAKHFFTRYNSFLITTTEREKLHMLTKQFGIDMSQ